VALSGSDPSRRIAPLREALVAVVGELTGSEPLVVEDATAPARSSIGETDDVGPPQRHLVNAPVVAAHDQGAATDP